MAGNKDNLNHLLQGLSLEEEIGAVSPPHAPPWVFSSVSPRHVNYSGLEPEPELAPIRNE